MIPPEKDSESLVDAESRVKTMLLERHRYAIARKPELLLDHVSKYLTVEELPDWTGLVRQCSQPLLKSPISDWSKFQIRNRILAAVSPLEEEYSKTHTKARTQHDASVSRVIQLLTADHSWGWSKQLDRVKKFTWAISPLVGSLPLVIDSSLGLLAASGVGVSAAGILVLVSIYGPKMIEASFGHRGRMENLRNALREIQTKDRELVSLTRELTASKDEVSVIANKVLIGHLAVAKASHFLVGFRSHLHHISGNRKPLPGMLPEVREYLQECGESSELYAVLVLYLYLDGAHSAVRSLVESASTESAHPALAEFACRCWLRHCKEMLGAGDLSLAEANVETLHVSGSAFCGILVSVIRGEIELLKLHNGLGVQRIAHFGGAVVENAAIQVSEIMEGYFQDSIPDTPSLPESTAVDSSRLTLENAEEYLATLASQVISTGMRSEEQLARRTMQSAQKWLQELKEAVVACDRAVSLFHSGEIEDALLAVQTAAQHRKRTFYVLEEVQNSSTHWLARLNIAQQLRDIYAWVDKCNLAVTRKIGRRECALAINEPLGQPSCGPIEPSVQCLAYLVEAQRELANHERVPLASTVPSCNKQADNESDGKANGTQTQSKRQEAAKCSENGSLGTEPAASASLLTHAKTALESGLKIARDCGFGLYHIDLLVARARLHLLTGHPDQALDDIQMALGNENGEGDGSPSKDQTGQPELLAARDPACGYAWPVPEGLQLKAEALLLQAAQRLGTAKVGCVELANGLSLYNVDGVLISDENSSQINQAKQLLSEALELWQPLHDPEPERDDQNFKFDGIEYNYKAAETYRVITDLDGGMLTRYPLESIGRDEESDLLAAESIPMSKRFSVALSFPGEHRDYVEDVAKSLSRTLTRDKVFYDKYYEAELARPNLDIYLQDIYHNQTELVVVMLCKEYDEKEWCGLEFRAIRNLIKERKDDEVMFVRVAQGDVKGVFGIDGYVDAEGRPAKDIAKVIHERLELVQKVNP